MLDPKVLKFIEENWRVVLMGIAAAVLILPVGFIVGAIAIVLIMYMGESH